MAKSTVGPARRLGEFDRIARFFAPLAAGVPGALGLLDDAALIEGGGRLAMTTDALVGGVHFVGDEPAALVARKALRVNLSDLAAMGAVPVAYTLALMLPDSCDDDWLAAFAAGLAEDQAAYGIGLAGGDTVATPGPLAISITALGRVTQPVTRGGAQPGDLLCVSGTIGDAALGLEVVQGRRPASADDARYLADRYRLPQPRTALGAALAGIASAGLDVSDGLVQDVGHIAAVSAAALVIDADRLPLSAAVEAALRADPAVLDRILGGGDDYELAFTVPPGRRDMVFEVSRATATPVTVIGRVEAGAPTVRVVDGAGWPIPVARGGWDHF